MRANIGSRVATAFVLAVLIFAAAPATGQTRPDRGASPDVRGDSPARPDSALPANLTADEVVHNR